MAAAKPSDDGPEPSPAGPNAGKEEPPAKPGPSKTESAQVRENEQKKKVMQHPVYFVSSLLQGARSRYSGIQKVLFGLLMASRKLRHYFQAHEITVVTPPPFATNFTQSRCDRED